MSLRRPSGSSWARRLRAKPASRYRAWRVWRDQVAGADAAVGLERFRRRWLSRALPAGEALDRLASWQAHTDRIIKLHYAFIAGENDSEADVHAICDALESRRLVAHVNIVRYNTADPERHGTEPPEDVIEGNAAVYRARMPRARVRVIPRVGFGVQASCGMFVS